MKNKGLDEIKDTKYNAIEIIIIATFLLLNNKNCDFSYIDKRKSNISIK